MFIAQGFTFMHKKDQKETFQGAETLIKLDHETAQSRRDFQTLYF